MANAIFKAKLVRDGGTLDGLPVVPEVGDFDVDRGIDTAAANAFDVSAATLQAALEALGTIGAGSIAVAEGKNAYHLIDITSLIAASFGYQPTNLVGGYITLNSPFSAASIQSEINAALAGSLCEVTEPVSDKFLVKYIGAFAATDAGQGLTDDDDVIVTVLTQGNVLVEWQLTFQGDLANTDINDLSVTGNSLKYKADTIAVDASVTDGVAVVQEVQTITLSSIPNTGDLVINGITVASGSSMAASQVATAIADAGGANKACGATGTTGEGPFVVTYTATENVSDSLLDFTGSTLAQTSSVIVATTQDGIVATQNEIQTITTDATTGTFTISLTSIPVVGSVTTGSLAFNADAATVEAAINAVLDAGQTVSCSGTLAGGMSVQFNGTLGQLDIDQMTTTDTNIGRLTNVSVATDTQGNAGAYQVATVSLTDAPTSGTLKVTVNAVDSDPFAYNADAATVSAAFGAQTIPFDASGTAPNWTLTATTKTANVTVTATDVTALQRDADIVLVEVQEGTEVATGGASPVVLRNDTRGNYFSSNPIIIGEK